MWDEELCALVRHVKAENDELEAADLIADYCFGYAKTAIWTVAIFSFAIGTITGLIF